MRLKNIIPLIVAMAYTASTMVLFDSTSAFLQIPFRLEYAALCFLVMLTSVLWLPSMLQLRLNIRLPIRSEETLIREALTEVQGRADEHMRIHIRIEESALMNASVIGRRTVILTTPLLQQLTSEELAAVLAHELAHLRSGDTMASTILYLNNCYVHRILLLIKYCRRLLGRKIFLLLLVLIILALIGYNMPLRILIAVTIMYIALSVIARIFNFLSLLASRYAEYRQDAFAESLGYGAAL